MKKIFSILVVGIFLASAFAVVNTGNIFPVEKNNDKNVIFEKKSSEDSEIKYDNYGYVTTSFPPKTQEQLDKMIKNPQMTVSSGGLPSQFNWRSFGGDWTTVAKDQGNCGSCWAFGALGAMEAAIDISSGNPSTNIDLSEQYILSCLGAAGSCSGGWMSETIEYIESENMGSTGNGVNGCTIESCFPYEAVDYIPCSDKCDDWDYLTDPPQPDNKLWEIETWGVTSITPSSQSDWDLLKSWVYTYGPLSVDIYASSGWSNFGWSHHGSTDVYEPSGSDSGMTNHAQVLCGWVDNPDIKNGGYWIIKNSWGTGFGYGGFTNVAYGCISLGDRDVTYVTTPAWPQGPDEGIPDVECRVYADFDYETDYGSKYPHVGDVIEFDDMSTGAKVSTREWDFNGDGVVDSTDNDPTWQYNIEGDYEVTLTVWSQCGLESYMTRTVGVYEIWNPVAGINPDDYADNELEVRFDGRDSYDPDGSIVGYEWDFGDGGTADIVNPEHEFSQPDMIYDVTLTVTDNDGATGSTTVPVKIDQTVPPVTTIHHGFGNNGAEWYKDTQRISFTATDWTSVIDTYYRVDNGDWIRYIPEEQKYIPVGAEGNHVIEAYSIDYYGNQEIPVTDEFGVDKTPPDLNIDLNGNLVDGEYVGPVAVTITAQDQPELSGLDMIQYKIQGKTNWIEVNNGDTFEISGSYCNPCGLEYMAVDKAGATNNMLEFIYINAPPHEPVIDGPSYGRSDIEYEFNFTAYDPLSEDLSYYIDWGDGSITGWTEPYNSGYKYAESHTWDTEGTYQITFKAKDPMNQISEKTDYITIREPTDSLIVIILQKLIDLFPFLEDILQPIIDNLS